VGLEDALAICLAFLDHEPASYARAVARWASRLTAERSLDLADAQLLFAALGSLPGAGARAGAEAVIELATRYGLDASTQSAATSGDDRRRYACPRRWRRFRVRC
jgi:hypothetical protein